MCRWPATRARRRRTPSIIAARLRPTWTLDHIFLFLQRSPQQEQALDKLINELNDRKSPKFHKWLTPEEFGERFGVAEEDIQQVTNWLQSHGFRINQVYTNHMLIDFSGTAAQVGEAFHTEIGQLEVGGEAHIANISDPQIPVALAPVVTGIFSLNDFKPHADEQAGIAVHLCRLHHYHDSPNRAGHLLRDDAAGQRRPSTT